MDNTLKIINYLAKHSKDSFTLHELSKLLAIPYASFYRTIPKIQELLEVKTIGRAKIIHLKPINPLIKSYLIISSEEEKKVFLQKQPLIKKIYSEINTSEIILLFGSYAKGKETSKSDIDL